MRFTNRAPYRGALAAAGLRGRDRHPRHARDQRGQGLGPGAATGCRPARSVRLYGSRGRVFLDPGIWVSALGSPLEFDVQRASYAKPLTITQIIRPPYGGIVRRPLPASILDGWNGLRGFTVLTVRNSAGKVVLTERVSFCPNSFDPARVNPAGPPATPYPSFCVTEPFQLAMVWGVQKGWAADPVQFGRPVNLPLGVYQVTGAISPEYVRLFGVPAKDATAAVKVTVAKPPRCCPVPGCCAAGRRHSARRAAPPPLPADAPALTHPPASALPDLVPLPSCGIRVSHPKNQTRRRAGPAVSSQVAGKGLGDMPVVPESRLAPRLAWPRIPGRAARAGTADPGLPLGRPFFYRRVCRDAAGAGVGGCRHESTPPRQVQTGMPALICLPGFKRLPRGRACPARAARHRRASWSRHSSRAARYHGDTPRVTRSGSGPARSGACCHSLSYSSWRRNQLSGSSGPRASFRPRGARSSHWYMPHSPSRPRA